MMSESLVTCPECGAQVKLNETLAAPIIKAERVRIDSEYKQRAAALQQREDAIKKERESVSSQMAELDRVKNEIDKTVVERVEKERVAIAKAAQVEATKAATAELEAVRRDLVEKNVKLAEAQKAELEIRKQRQALEEEKRQFDLKLARTLDAERQKIRDVVRAEETEKASAAATAEMKAMKEALAEKEAKLAEAQAAELETRKQRQALEDEKREFDLKLTRTLDQERQKIRDAVRAEETRKATKATSADQRNAKAEIAAIMSAALPKDLTTFDHRDGVWVTSPVCVIPVSTALRQTLVEAASARRALENQQGKMEMMYGYLTSLHFKQRVTAIVESYVGLRAELESERRAFNRIWAKREKQLDRMLGGVTGMYGDLQGIVGTSLPEVDGLELPMLEAPDDADDVQDENTDSTKSEAAQRDARAGR